VVLLTSGGTVLLLVALGLLVAAGRVNRARSRNRPVAERGLARLARPVVAAPLAAGLLLIGLATFTVTPLASPLYLNLGAVTRERATLTDGLSRAERERGLAQADGFLRRALAADSNDPAIWRNLAEVSIARGDVGRARDYLAEARSRTSLGDAYALFQLGRISRDAGLWDDAARAWREGQALNALQAWAQEARSREQWDRAAIALSAVAELRPTDGPTFQQLTQALRRARGDDAAIQALQRLATALPRSPLPYVELANLYAERGQLQAAASAREEAARRGGR
jgi:tetratricopeptide (TPR) repeat protein